MHSVLSFAAAATLLVAAVLGVRTRTQLTAGISVAALAAGTAALLSALPTADAPLAQAQGVGLTALAVGLIGSGLFATVAALSRRLRAISPIAVGGGILVLQVLLLFDGALAALTQRGAGIPASPQLVILAGVTVAWPVAAGAGLVVIGRRVVRFVDSGYMKALLRAAALLLGLGALGLVGRVLLELIDTPAPERDALVGATELLLFGPAFLLGSVLIGTRLRAHLRPLLENVTAAVLFLRLRWLEDRLSAAVPRWARPAGIAAPQLRQGARYALYARMVVIWDATRALLSAVPISVVDASVDFADKHAPGAPLLHRAALAEASWLSWALDDQSTAETDQGTFQIRDQVPSPDAGELIAEARYQLRIVAILRRRDTLHRRFVDHVERSASTTESP